MELLPHQTEVVDKLSNGKILWGGVGSGKSVAALGYYDRKDMCGDIYVITTAKKRDSLEWERDASAFGIGTEADATVSGVLRIDSWNNIGKYEDVEGCTFFFDEQRLIGSGSWVRSFYKIAKKNSWIVLSATPGDTWMDYVPVFVANGFYKNKSQFIREHVLYEPFVRYPKIKGYMGVAKLEALKKELLVEMPYMKHTIRHHEEVPVEYDADLLKKVINERWNVFRDEPIKNISELFSVVRRVCYGDPSRLEAVKGLMERHDKLVIFYNFNYELERLRSLSNTWSDLYEVGEWNGSRKQPIPDSDRWVYFVQYTSGSEGWNCTETNAMIFYSLPYSFKRFEQSQGRIDRLNTPFTHLYYYSLFSKSFVDRAVKASLESQKTFNERSWAMENGVKFDEN